MTSSKYLGKHQLYNRLAEQVGSHELAKKILISRGHMDEAGNLTEEGKKRDAMTAAERAKDREHKKTGAPISELEYDSQTNTARFTPNSRFGSK